MSKQNNNNSKKSILADRRTLTAFVFFLTGIFVFIAAAIAIQYPQVRNLDTSVLNSLSGSETGHLWLRIFMSDITTLGSGTIIFLLVVFVIIYFIIVNRKSAALLIFSASVGGGVLTVFLKSFFQRHRPSVIISLINADSLSFPSGHSTLSAAIYLSLAALLSIIYKERAVQVYFIAAASFLTFLIGYSRVYLGVHYPIDVIGGWSLGVAWASFCWLIVFFLQRKKIIGLVNE
ncbi:MAG: phosphatase PAP2 family protein [Ignavibacteriaceae bacterium]|nr:phosphatase PAP2 family protein [Ignavibacteriaceae bacterium]